MAGGDGSQALVASIAVECGVPFVCVTAGTRNHFAQDLGLDRNDPRVSVHAFRDAVERRIDYATVNDRFFVNNVSLGVYAAIVQQDGYRDAKVETTKAMLPELLGNTDAPFDLQFTTPDGSRGRRRLRHPGLEQPVCAGILPRRRATTPHRHGRARCHRPHRSHWEGRRRSPRARRRRSTKPQPELARVHRRELRGPLAIGYRLRRRRRRGTRDADPDGVPDLSPWSPSPGTRRKPRSRGATSRPQRQPPRSGRCRHRAIVIAATCRRERAELRGSRRPGRRRDTLRRRHLRVSARLHRLLRSVHPPAETGGCRGGRRTRRALDVRGRPCRLADRPDIRWDFGRPRGSGPRT